jgi:hypothetical protein
MKNVLAKTYKIKVIQYSKYKPSCSMVFSHFSALECLVKSLFVFGSKKFFNCNFYVCYRLKLSTTKELGHRTKQIVV